MKEIKMSTGDVHYRQTGTLASDLRIRSTYGGGSQYRAPGPRGPVVGPKLPVSVRPPAVGSGDVRLLDDPMMPVSMRQAMVANVLGECNMRVALADGALERPVHLRAAGDTPAKRVSAPVDPVREVLAAEARVSAEATAGDPARVVIGELRRFGVTAPSLVVAEGILRGMPRLNGPATDSTTEIASDLADGSISVEEAVSRSQALADRVSTVWKSIQWELRGQVQVRAFAALAEDAELLSERLTSLVQAALDERDEMAFTLQEAGVASLEVQPDDFDLAAQWVRARRAEQRMGEVRRLVDLLGLNGVPVEVSPVPRFEWGTHTVLIPVGAGAVPARTFSIRPIESKRSLTSRVKAAVGAA